MSILLRDWMLPFICFFTLVGIGVGRHGGPVRLLCRAVCNASCERRRRLMDVNGRNLAAFAGGNEDLASTVWA